MADTFIRYSSVSQQSFSKLIFAYLQLHLAALWSVGICILWETKLLAATEEKPRSEGTQMQGFRDISPPSRLPNSDQFMPKTFLLAAPENFNPDLRIPPPPPKPPKQSLFWKISKRTFVVIQITMG